MTFPPSDQGDTLGTPPPFDSVEAWLAVLEHRVKSRDAVAVRLAFEIEPFMGSGDFSETLDIMLGDLISLDPRLFLTELRAQEHRQSNLGVPGANLGGDFVDDFKAQCRELRLRVRALQGVSDSALTAVKRRAVRSLATAAREECRN